MGIKITQIAGLQAALDNALLPKYLPVVSHPAQSITQSRGSEAGVGTTGPFTYTLSDFIVTGEGYDSSRVVAAYVYCEYDCDSCEYVIEMKYPDGSWQTLLGLSPGPTSGSDENSPKATIPVPVNPGQPSLELQVRIISDPAAGSGTDTGSFTIIGLQQFG